MKYKVEVVKHRITTEVYTVEVEAENEESITIESIDEDKLVYVEAIDAEPHVTEIESIKLIEDSPIEVSYEGEDYWNRGLYRSADTGRVYASVNGVLHVLTEEGEPLMPLFDFSADVANISFKTEDGNVLKQQFTGSRLIWIDGEDLEFNDRWGWPIDANNKKLRGERMTDKMDHDLSALEAITAMYDGYVVEDNENLYHYTAAKEGEISKYRKSEGYILTDSEFMRMDCLFKVVKSESRTFVS